MKTLYNSSDVSLILDRLNRLSPASQALWGKMNASQMLAHCAGVMEMATGERKPKRLFIGKLIGGFLKAYSSEKPFGKNTPTDPTVQINDQRDFETEKQKLQAVIQRFQAGGEDKCTRHPHSFFGKVSPADWGTGMYKHLDHHFRQFGV